MAPFKVSDAFAGHVARSETRLIVALSSRRGSIELNPGGDYAYRSSKAALNSVMKGLAGDLRGRGITVCVLHPGWVRTDMGGQGADLEVGESAAGLHAVIAGLGEGETVEMGFGATLERYHDTFARPSLIFAGHPFSFEAMTVMELKGVGQRVPARFAAHVAACETDTWLIPKGEAPFAMPSYWGDGPVFDDAIRQGFLEAYGRDRASRLFDVWTCKDPG